MAAEDKDYGRMVREEYIDRYLEKQLSEEEVKEFELRCMEDRHLFNKVQERKLFQEQVKQVIEKDGAMIFRELIAAENPDLVQPKMFIEKLLQFWSDLSAAWKYALIPAAVAAVVLLMVINFGNIFTPDIPQDGPFAELAQYEEIIKNPGRSLSLTITFKSPLPQNNKMVSPPVEFKWVAEPDTALTLVIVNNKDEIIKKIPNLKNGFSLTDSLAPGLYYWKLITAQELVYLGKFVVRGNKD